MTDDCHLNRVSFCHRLIKGFCYCLTAHTELQLSKHTPSYCLAQIRKRSQKHHFRDSSPMMVAHMSCAPLNVQPSAQGYFSSLFIRTEPFTSNKFSFFGSGERLGYGVGGKTGWDPNPILKWMRAGYSQNSNKITHIKKSHLVNITFCFCLRCSFYTTWQFMVLCHISELRFTNIWLWATFQSPWPPVSLG